MCRQFLAEQALGILDDPIYSQPFTTPFNLDVDALLRKDQPYIKACQKANGDILSHVSTANVARDMDPIRGQLGERKLNYFGYSYGTFLGATYASLFPKQLPGDGARRADRREGVHQQAWRDLAEQTAGFERALGRFFQACAARPGGVRGLRRRATRGTPTTS